MFNAYFQRIRPVGDTQTESFFDFGLVQHGVSRAFHWAGELVAVARLDVTFRVARHGGNRLGKVIP